MFYKYLLSILFFTTKKKNSTVFSRIIFIPITDCTCKIFSIFFKSFIILYLRLKPLTVVSQD
jgi:hypothetical protein